MKPNVTHCVLGYDRRTEALKITMDVPARVLQQAKRIAKVARDDPDAAWSYELTAGQAKKITDLTGDPSPDPSYDYFLEPYAPEKPSVRRILEKG